MLYIWTDFEHTIFSVISMLSDRFIPAHPLTEVHTFFSLTYFINFRWEASQDDGGADVKHYIVEYFR